MALNNTFSNATCLTPATMYPNMTEIEECQSRAESIYCYPPNGTRICVPTEDVPFYWPPKYYHSDAKICLEYDLNSYFAYFRYNWGNKTQEFTPAMYEAVASPIPGQLNEKMMRMYLLERRFNTSLDPYNLETYDGPKLILVKTAEFPSRTRSYGITATVTTQSSNHNSHSSSGISSQKAAGIALATIFGIIAVLVLLCCRCCLGRRNKNAGGVNGRAEDFARRVPDLQTQSENIPSRTQGTNFGEEMTTLDMNNEPQRPTRIRDADLESLPPYNIDKPPKYSP
ncbi:uncharacterized protein BDR25DRAFT_338957 [Lindgomyces ingoldianus]|uniref:Uncharacterized protein n=1 Tax=Lindgomyces ingoldianus TaxID=673940 RepID=A0ACB6RCM3_9PLEO|nr:uncharacterized protein BDR25DRAFT_338957 [Lindgomyces ingoldianus]KAF2476805.1 hypothetical protein BDR25DRAFT_338957 [Lindgomyces ingoldianus]